MPLTPDPPTSAPPEGEPSAEPAESTETVEQAFASLRGHVDELFDYAIYYLISRLDAVKLAIKRRIVMAAAMLVTVLAAAGAIVTAVVLLCEGICDGLSSLLGHRWAGELVTSLLLLALVFGAGTIAIERLFIGHHQTMVDRYEAMRRRQKQRRGRDVRDRAAEDARHG